MVTTVENVAAAEASSGSTATTTACCWSCDAVRTGAFGDSSGRSCGHAAIELPSLPHVDDGIGCDIAIAGVAESRHAGPTTAKISSIARATFHVRRMSSARAN